MYAGRWLNERYRKSLNINLSNPEAGFIIEEYWPIIGFNIHQGNACEQVPGLFEHCNCTTMFIPYSDICVSAILIFL